jgi:hypothetical protein
MRRRQPIVNIGRGTAPGWRTALLVLVLAVTAPAQTISIPTDEEILADLKAGVPGLQEVYALRDQGHTAEALQKLAASLREQSTGRYFFNWQEFDTLFALYNSRYPGMRNSHLALAQDHISTYPADTEWILPFRNLHGKEVTAYELRHLARQNKSRDMALASRYEGDPHYLRYWLAQVEDLNRAFIAGAYDQAGNGIYEGLRGGLRVQNWLFAHHLFLADKSYDARAQLLLIRTLLHHGAMLQKETKKFRSGNHHTKGLTALFELAVIFADFRTADLWREQAIAGLTRHMQQEINPDGFQFERSVHYHIGDIDNYFRVSQLAQLNGIALPEDFTTRFRGMFTALAKLAQPNRRLPVLQDDTDAAYRENNDIRYPMSAGTLLFGDPLLRYFAGDEIPAELFWLVRPEQHDRIYRLSGVAPDYTSLALEQSGYYCMRSGWDQDDLYMTISAGLSQVKPDHQHGDMLGLVAWANGHEILPNYQVSYNTPEYPWWKNSWVKNVALADSILLGQRWTPNEGGSGFGKWGRLPKPRVLAWRTLPEYDYFRGSHNAYDSLGVGYFREVLFVKAGFWIVRDHFTSADPHTWQQVWQGHYQRRGARSAVSGFADGSGLEIIQLAGPANAILPGGRRDKGSAVFQTRGMGEYTFTTLLHPFRRQDERLDPPEDFTALQIGEWRIARDAGGDLLLTGPASAEPFRLPVREVIVCPGGEGASAPEPGTGERPATQKGL